MPFDTLLAWAKARPQPWIGAMEATLLAALSPERNGDVLHLRLFRP